MPFKRKSLLPESLQTSTLRPPGLVTCCFLASCCQTGPGHALVLLTMSSRTLNCPKTWYHLQVPILLRMRRNPMISQENSAMIPARDHYSRALSYHVPWDVNLTTSSQPNQNAWKLVSGRFLARSLSASNCFFRAYAEPYQMQILIAEIVTLQEDHNTIMLQSIIIIT